MESCLSPSVKGIRLIKGENNDLMLVAAYGIRRNAFDYFAHVCELPQNKP